MTEEKKEDNTINLVANLAVLVAQVVKDLNSLGTVLNQNSTAINQMFQRLNGVEIFMKNQLDAEVRKSKNGCCVTPPPEAPPVAPPEAPSV